MKPFSKFTLSEALALIGSRHIQPWTPRFEKVAVSPEFTAMLSKAREHIDLKSSEAAKVLVIDLILLEAIDPIPNLKFWKQSPLETKSASGVVDYLLAENAAIVTQPLLAVVEAKKDDFDLGRAQCLAEMAACHELNQADNADIELIHGIVSNGSGWQLLRWNTVENEVQESLLYAETDLEDLIGVIRHVLQSCSSQISSS